MNPLDAQDNVSVDTFDANTAVSNSQLLSQFMDYLSIQPIQFGTQRHFVARLGRGNKFSNAVQQFLALGFIPGFDT